ncbi:hypothetical protein M758_UG163800 [Ceratodon purpureus]|nr:hypothetical protein M758_UG163800 [Ceratodon purpureus]
MILSNDRYKWHKHYVRTLGGQHEDCPDEAFVALRLFRESPEGKAKSETMSKIRSKVGKDVSLCSERDVEITPTRTRPSMSALDGFHTPRTEPVKFANPYDTPMCSDWIMEAPTEYEATETLASQAHSPEVVNSTSLQQGTPSCNQYITPEKVRDAWKEGMESRMDFLQTNLTELLHLIKQGISSNHRQPTEILPNVQEDEKTTAVAECILQNPETPPSRVDGTTALSEPENKAGPGDTSEGIDRHRSLYPNTQSPCSGETAILSPIMCTQAEISNSGSSPPLTSPRTSHGTHSPSDAVTETTSNVHTSKVDVQGTRSIAPVSGVVLTGQGILTRGVRGRKAGFCSKAPPEFQPAKDTDTPVPSKKLVWIIHPEHGEVIVASGRTGPGPRSKVVKDGPPCLIGAQWIHVLRVFKHAVGVMHPCPDDDRRTLDCALPPKRGRHELLLWNSRYLIPYKVDESTCTSP